VAETGGSDAPAPVRRINAVVVVALVVALAAVGTWFGAEVLGSRGLPARASAEGRHVERTWQILMGMAGAVAGVVLALLVVALVDGVRTRNGPEPQQSAGSVRLELVYTALPLALVAAVFVIALQGSERLDADPPVGARRVEVTGFRWGWRFDYGEGGPSIVGTEQDEPELVLPVDEPVVLELTSDDVIHSFYTPAFLTKLDVIPGRTNELTVKPSRLGTFVGHCAEFCGLDHARMNFTVRVVTGDEFERWRDDATRAGGGA
jgi:cytochrome c oxidase subunit 2